MMGKKYLIAIDPEKMTVAAANELHLALEAMGIDAQLVGLPDNSLKVFELGESTDPEPDELKADVLKTSIGVLQALCAELEGSLAVYEAEMEPIFWICYHKNCGSPNQTPRMLYPWIGTVAASLICLKCKNVQPTDYLQQFV